MEDIARNELLSDLTFEFDAMGTVFGDLSKPGNLGHSQPLTCSMSQPFLCRLTNSLLTSVKFAVRLRARIWNYPARVRHAKIEGHSDHQSDDQSDQMRRLFQTARSSRRNGAGNVTSRSTARPARAESSHWHPISRDPYCPREGEGSSKPSQILANRAALQLSAAASDVVAPGSAAIAAPVTVEPFEVPKRAPRARRRFAASFTATLIAAALLGLSMTRYAD
jgi:hypothetical protein